MALVYDTLGETENSINWLDKAIDLNPDPLRLEQLKIIFLSENRVDAIIEIVQKSDIPEEEKSVVIAEKLLALSGSQSDKAKRWSRTGNEIAAKEATELSELAFAKSLKYQKIAEESGVDTIEFIFTQFGTAMRNKDFEVAQSLLERVIESGADPVVIGSSEIQLLLAIAQESGAFGEKSGAN
jgi:tetratricopeptide (TPR) repeat protein